MLDFLREVVKLEWLRKFTAREFFLLALFLAVASIVVRLLSDDFLKAWEITDIGQLRQYSGIAGVLSVVLFVTIFLARLQKWLQHERICYRTKRLFHNLTNHQKQILKNFLDNKDRTRYFQFDDGVVNDLMAAGVISRSAEPTTMRGYRGIICAYTLNDWAWDYLNKHPELLSGDGSAKEQNPIAQEIES